MANLLDRNLYGYTYSKHNDVDSIGIQYHITNLCDLRCKHCYMGGERISDELSKEENIKLLHELEKYLKNKNKIASMTITGGDPILSEKFWSTLLFIKESKYMKGTSVLGNSFHLNRTVVEEMKQAGVDFYQVSLDGLEKTHDENRRRGSFEDAIRALELLHDAGIYTSVMFTVSRSNYEEFIPLYRFVEQLGCVDVIGFDKMIPIGSAKMRSDYVSPEEYRDFLYAVYKYIVFEKPVTRFSFKDNLWKLFLDENGLLSPYQKDQDAIINGCLVCNAASISILPNGEVMPCRRLDITLDNCMHKNIEEIFDGDFYEKLLEKKQYEKCNQCDLFSYCRGCLAIKYSTSRDLMAEDVYCWRKFDEK